MATRIYTVKISASEVTKDGIRLVRASSQAAAIGHVIKSFAAASVATQGDLVAALGAGVQVENAGESVQEKIDHEPDAE